jgi:hypothetical protein
MALKQYVPTGAKRRIPDIRVHITKTIVLLEYRNGLDVTIQRGDARAEKIAKLCTIT